MPTLRTTILAGSMGVGLTVVFWFTLWAGGGFVGGDVYSYYFPQKTLYAEALRAGELPFWNPRAGHGYPLVGESQTGVFYPFHMLFYRLLNVNCAYDAIHLLHYVLAFAFAAMYARTIGLTLTAGLFAGLVYTYGWFPSRCCVEWAIIGGAWFPAALACAEMFLQTQRLRYAMGLVAALSLQMLAGHFEIAFIAQLTLVAYVPLRIWVAPVVVSAGRTFGKSRIAAVCLAAMLLSYGVAAAQLLPTLELKQHSQRATAEGHELEFGSIPVWYWSQMIMPWHWYSPTTNRDALLQEFPAAFGARTNQIEAHLYFGLIPLLLATWGIVNAVRRRDRLQLIWLLLGMAALIYTTGWLLPLTRHLPGFSFFQGPGRYGIVTTLAVALLASSAIDGLLSARKLTFAASAILFAIVAAALLSAWSLVSDVDLVVTQSGRPQANPLTSGQWALTLPFMTVAAFVGAGIFVVAIGCWAGLGRKSLRLASTAKMLSIACLFAVTTVDLWVVSRLVTYSTLIDDPPIQHLAESPLREILAPLDGNARLYAPGANLPNCLGVASTPVYLTFGPAAYVNPDMTMPVVSDSAADSVLKTSPAQLDWLRRAGVTHVLSFKPLDRETWPVEPLWQNPDPFFKRAWGRFEPMHLYRLNFPAELGSGRLRFEEPAPRQKASVAEHTPNRVVIEAESSTDSRLILTELMYPGWKVAVDGVTAEPIEVENMYRAVDLAAGSHTIDWTYRPAMLYWGAGISLVALALLAAVAHVAYWHPDRLAFIKSTSRFT